MQGEREVRGECEAQSLGSSHFTLEFNSPLSPLEAIKAVMGSLCVYGCVREGVYVLNLL